MKIEVKRALTKQPVLCMRYVLSSLEADHFGVVGRE